MASFINTADRFILADSLQFRLLRLIAPKPKGYMSGAAYTGKSKLRVLLGDAVVQALVSAGTVIDFGCGDGAESVELAQCGCRVTGVDIREAALARAAQLAADAGVSDRCRFTTSPEPADAIISIDSFEHFADPALVLHVMASMLRPGGRIYVSFGSTWFHPLGGHMFSVFPWAHLIFSETALLAWRNQFRTDGATRFGEVEGGLNQMTIARFERLVKESSLHIESLECVPIRPMRRLHCHLTREWTTSLVRAVLRHKSPDPHGEKRQIAIARSVVERFDP